MCHRLKSFDYPVSMFRGRLVRDYPVSMCHRLKDYPVSVCHRLGDYPVSMCYSWLRALNTRFPCVMLRIYPILHLPQVESFDYPVSMCHKLRALTTRFACVTG